MDDSAEPRLPGMEPLATMTHRAFIMPDGRISHYEVEGRGPTGDLIAFRAQADGGVFVHSNRYQESLAHFEQLLREIPIEP